METSKAVKSMETRYMYCTCHKNTCTCTSTLQVPYMYCIKSLNTIVSVAVRSAVFGEGSEKQFEASDNLVSSLIV